MKETLVIPFLLTLLFFGAVLYAAEPNRHLKMHKLLKREVLEIENFELKPSVLVI